MVLPDVMQEPSADGDLRTVSFGECATLIRENVSVPDSEDVPYIGLEHIGQGTLSLLAYGHSNSVTSTKARFQRGDILFGKLRPYFRKVVRAPFDGICSTDIWVVRAKEGVDLGFLYYCMASWPFVDFATAGAQGTRMPRAKWEHVSRYEIVLPPLAEQRSIAHILGTLDDKIELNRRMNETLEEMARALFKSWFVDFDPVRAKMEGRWQRGETLPGMPAELYDLFPDGMVDSELGEIPAGWEVKGLGDIIELAYGKALKADNRRDGTIPVYGSNGQVGWHDEKLVPGPGIVVGRKGNPGIVTWVHSDFFPIDTTFYVLPKSSEQKLLFLFFALADQNLPSIAADSAVPGLNRNLAYMNRMLVPAIAPTNIYDEYAKTLFARRIHLQAESLALAALRDVLLPRLISGKLPVTQRRIRQHD